VHVYESTSGVVTNSSFGRGFGAKATGGVVGLSTAATGGIRGNRVLVGEHGIEIADLPPGTMVHSNPDTQRMLAQGYAGGEVTVRLEWVGGGDDPLFQMLRKGIRARAGGGPDSVQKALGQPF